MLQLEVGKYYRAVNGAKVYVIRNDEHLVFPFDGDNGCSYTSRGTEYEMSESSNDLIEEWKDDEETPLVRALEGLADMVNQPPHYTSHPSGIECIEVTRHMSFNLGNAMKYIWRADLKNGIEDLEKAAWYIKDEIAKRQKAG